MTNRSKLWLFIGLLLLIIVVLIITSKPYPTELTTDELVRLDVIQREAYAEAVECSDTKTPKLKYEDIDWVIIPDSKLRIQATDGNIDLAGYFSQIDSVIYLPYPNRDKRWILIHESLHAIGYIGHPDTPFRYPCRVMADQH